MILGTINKSCTLNATCNPYFVMQVGVLHKMSPLMSDFAALSTVTLLIGQMKPLGFKILFLKSKDLTYLIHHLVLIQMN